MTEVLRGQWAKQDKKVIKETKDCSDWWDPKESKVRPALRVLQVQKVQLGHEVFQELKDQEGLVVDLESLVRKVTLGLQGLPVEMEFLEYQDHQGHKGPEDQQDLQV